MGPKKIPNKPPQVTQVKLDPVTSAFLSELKVDVNKLTLNESSVKNVLNTLIKTIGQLKNEITQLRESGSEISSDEEEWEVKVGKGKNGTNLPRGGGGDDNRRKGYGVPINIQAQVRNNSDQIDNNQQRNMKGTILFASPENAAKNLKSILKEPEEIGEEQYTQQICDTIEKYYGVHIDPALDIEACHPTSKGCGIIRFNNRRMGSAYAKLCSAILKGPKPSKTRKEEEIAGQPGERKRGATDGNEMEGGAMEGEASVEGAQKGEARKVIRPNFWLTFQLTKRRSDLIRKLKELKRDGKINHFTSNENGIITVTLKKGAAPKRLTMDYKNENSKTYYVSELLQLVSC